jgi:hypothetical protein
MQDSLSHLLLDKLSHAPHIQSSPGPWGVKSSHWMKYDLKKVGDIPQLTSWFCKVELESIQILSNIQIASVLNLKLKSKQTLPKPQNIRLL